MEHGRVIPPSFVSRDRVGRVLRHGIDPEALRQTCHAIAVAHPDRVAPARSPHALKQSTGLEDLDIRAAEFGRMPAFDLAAKLLAQGLLAVANGKDWDAALEDFLRRAGAARLRNRRRPAGQDRGLGLEPRERFGRLRERVDLAIDACLAHAPRDQLRDLRAEVDDEDRVVAHGVHVADERRSRNSSSSRSCARDLPCFDNQSASSVKANKNKNRRKSFDFLFFIFPNQDFSKGYERKNKKIQLRLNSRPRL